MGNDERRTFERFPFSARLEVRLGRGTGPEALSATALDVSVRGFGFRSTSPLSVGDVIAVTLPDLAIGDEGPLVRTSPEDDPDLEIVAIVRHIHHTDEADGNWIVGAERAA